MNKKKVRIILTKFSKGGIKGAYVTSKVGTDLDELSILTLIHEVERN